jgi:uncharacterized protein YkwD
MGRHRRVIPSPATPAHPPEPPTASRHGRHRGVSRRPAPVRTGLLGASAALAVGAVAVSSGLVPGPGGTFTLADPDAQERVRAGGTAGLTPRGGASGPPTDRASRAAERKGLRDGSPSPLTSRSAGEEETRAEQSTAASPDGAPEQSATGSGSGEAPDTPAGARDESPARTATPEPGTSGGSDDGSGAGSGSGSGSGSDQATTAETRVLSLVNAERAKVGCAPLTADPELAALAEGHSEDMAERGYFSHTTPDGRSPWDRAEAAGVENMGGENIARGQTDAEAVMESWMHSEGHRANILNCDFTTLGVGGHFAQGGPWWTQTFGY